MRVLTPIVTALKSAQFDSKAFKVIPLSKAKLLKKGMKIELHPAMHKIDFISPNLEDALRPFTYNEDYEELIPLPSTEEIKSQPFYKEFATNPPCTTMYLNLAQGGIVSNIKGVTIENVIKRSIRLWNNKPNQRIAKLVFEADYTNAKSIKEVTLIDCLGDHRFFEGWLGKTEVVVDSKGRLQVRIDPGFIGS